jgi:hypothetical protein
MRPHLEETSEKFYSRTFCPPPFKEKLKANKANKVNPLISR